MHEDPHLSIAEIPTNDAAHELERLIHDLYFSRAPIDIDDLIARLQALKRRDSGSEYTTPSLYVNFRTAEVLRDGQRVVLTALELHLLEYFVDHPGEVLSRQELLDKVWGYEASSVTRTVDVRIAALRRKLERNPSQPEMILTIHRFGYKFVDRR